MEETNTNLIVNYLPQMLTDAEFKNLFMTVGHVKSYKIIRDKATGYSYGYGFVNYTYPEDAARAIKTLNGFHLQNKDIKVSYSRPGGKAIKNANLYVSNIPRHFNESQLRAIFSKFGKIIQCKVLSEGSGYLNKGIGFVLFDQWSQAEEAIQKLNGQFLEGGIEPLSVRFAEDKYRKVRPQVNTACDTQSFAGAAMASRFDVGGPVRDTFQSSYCCNPLANDMAHMAGYAHHSTALAVGGKGHVLFVYNIGRDTDEKTLWEIFSPYGTLRKVNVIRDGATGNGKGYGFVTMVNYNEALLAIESLNGSSLFGKRLQVSFKTSTHG